MSRVGGRCLSQICLRCAVSHFTSTCLVWANHFMRLTNFYVRLINVVKSRVVGSCVGGRALMREMFQLASLHDIKPIVDKMPLDKCNEAVDRLMGGGARYRCALWLIGWLTHDWCHLWLNDGCMHDWCQAQLLDGLMDPLHFLTHCLMTLLWLRIVEQARSMCAAWLCTICDGFCDCYVHQCEACTSQEKIWCVNIVWLWCMFDVQGHEAFDMQKWVSILMIHTPSFRLTCFWCVQDCSGDWRSLQQGKLVSVGEIFSRFCISMYRIQIPLRASTDAARLQGLVIVARVCRHVIWCNDKLLHSRALS